MHSQIFIIQKLLEITWGMCIWGWLGSCQGKSKKKAGKDQVKLYKQGVCLIAKTINLELNVSNAIMSIIVQFWPYCFLVFSP